MSINYLPFYKAMLAEAIPVWEGLQSSPRKLEQINMTLEDEAGL